jgi:hypothetical protein
MRIVIVNHCHPETPHVCATRAREFAAALTRRGHRVVLLAETLAGAAPVPPSEDVLARHDWSQPLWLSAMPLPAPLLDAQRRGQLPRILSRPLVAWHYLTGAGVFPDWREAALRQIPVLAACFRPDAVWAIFGNTECLTIAQSLARHAGCRWIIDMKDPWTSFIPAPFRRLLARRYQNAAAITALSGGHARESSVYFSSESKIVYSGIPSRMLTLPETVAPTRSLVVSGGLYGARDAQALADGLRAFLTNAEASGAERWTLTYAGSDSERAEQIFGPLRANADLRIEPFLPFDIFERLIAKASVNLYVRNPAALFQHKLFELLAAGRPIVACPPESAEARGIALACGGRLHEADSAGSVTKALELTTAETEQYRASLAAYSWDAQAAILENVLSGASSA